jgi:hypothetical protein
MPAFAVRDMSAAAGVNANVFRRPVAAPSRRRAFPAITSRRHQQHQSIINKMRAVMRNMRANIKTIRTANTGRTAEQQKRPFRAICDLDLP